MPFQLPDLLRRLSPALIGAAGGSLLALVMSSRGDVGAGVWWMTPIAALIAWAGKWIFDRVPKVPVVIDDSAAERRDEQSHEELRPTLESTPSGQPIVEHRVIWFLITFVVFISMPAMNAGLWWFPLVLGAPAVPVGFLLFEGARTRAQTGAPAMELMDLIVMALQFYLKFSWVGLLLGVAAGLWYCSMNLSQ